MAIESMIRALRNVGRTSLASLRDLVFPPSCGFCEADIAPNVGEAHLCEACRVAIVKAETYRCPRCAAKVAETFRDGDCPWCRGHGLKFDRAVTIGTHGDEVREAVLRLKLRGFEALGTALAQELWNRARETLEAERIDIVVPIPMYWWRRLRRGWNSPELTASFLARKLGIRDYPRLLVRRRNTHPQAGLSPNERIDNVRRAFKVRRGYRVRDANVLLVDDVLTTGATCSEATRALKDSGAARVVVAVLSRAQGET